ncbi:MAG: hypothetical protein JO184_20430 [Gammaproteobacteria bacterium]|nr:hypothetical protein [Gammaproteobacteria bacterium]MBV8403305.1 hypothetical protein [Gammaproteobacteria bacterium]
MPASHGATSTPPSLFLSASPSSVSSGGTAQLTWSSTNASSCTASGGWSGNEPAGGNASTGSLASTTTYTLSCTGPGGMASRSVTVSVNVVTLNGSSCSATSGGLTLRASAARKSGASPLLAFFDATGSSSSAVAGNATTFQDISYSWTFGDAGSSGTGTWTYGSNGGHNLKNVATGGVAAHLYVTGGADVTYPVTVTAYDGTNTASCQLHVTAYDPAGANGFPGTQTTCVFNNTAGSACPVGAALFRTQNIDAALSSAFGSNRRVLFNCGDTFSGSYSISSGVSRASIGAYGGCEGTSTGRPVFQNSSGSTISLGANNPTDIRIADIDFEDGSGTARAVSTAGGLGETQITLYNLNCNGMQSCYYLDQASQSGLIQSTATGMTTSAGTYWNYAGNNCLNGSVAAGCGGSGGYYDVSYNALLGNSLDGQGATSGGSPIDTVRVGACRMCVIADNTFRNANNLGAVLNLHSGNTAAGQATWIGQYTELVQVSDNLFTGAAGAQLVETAPQNPSNDERLRNVVVERSLFLAVSGGAGRQILVSAVNETLRDNVFNVSAADATPPQYAAQVAQRGMEPVPQYVELYNNSCYALQTMGSCIGFDGTGFAAPGNNSWASNTLFYDNAMTTAVVVDHGSGNTVGTNSADSSLDPLMADASGTFGLISDFQPTQNYAGGSAVPVWYDALAVAWSPTWSLGAVAP